MNRNNSRRKKLFSPSLPWWRMPELMSKLRALDGMSSRALEFQILTAARSSEVRGAQWFEIDSVNKTWTVSADRTRLAAGRCIPLSDAATSLLESLPRSEACQLVFPRKNGGALSIQDIVKVIDYIHKADIERGGAGFKDPLLDKTVTPHGARHAFKEWASKSRYPGGIVALCLGQSAHTSISAAYHREYALDVLEKCGPVMQEWARAVYAQPDWT